MAKWLLLLLVLDGPVRAPPLVLSLPVLRYIHYFSYILSLHTQIHAYKHIIIMHTVNTQCAVYTDELSSYSPQSFHI